MTEAAAAYGRMIGSGDLLRPGDSALRGLTPRRGLVVPVPLRGTTGPLELCDTAGPFGDRGGLTKPSFPPRGSILLLGLVSDALLLDSDSRPKS